MSRRKKTREQKKIADLRKKLQEQTSPSVMQTKASGLPSQPMVRYNIPLAIKKDSLYSPSSYVTIVHDVRKTFLLTTSIITVELILFFLLTHHIVTIPMLRY